MTTRSVDLITANYSRAKQTFVIPLAVENIQLIAADIERIGYSGDVWELRVDLLQDTTRSNHIPRAEVVVEQIRLLQKLSPLPIIFALRTVTHGGRFPNDGVDEAMKLMLVALKESCEYIDIESTWPTQLISQIIARKGNSKIIASHHELNGKDSWESVYQSKRSVLEEYGGTWNLAQVMVMLTSIDILKVSASLVDIADCFRIAIASEESMRAKGKPIIAVGMGEMGQLASIIGSVTFVTHDLLPNPSATGQMTLAQIHQAQHMIGRLPSKSFHIFGNRISHSLSPTIHNAAFQELGLPHRYTSFETPRVDDEVRRMIARPDFGGASVTTPHKLQIQPLLDTLTDAAKSIGAVNTVIVDDCNGRKLIGDNTDWIGILNLIRRSLTRPVGNATVIGAGGAARAAVFALQTFGWDEINLINRSGSTAETLAKDFPSLKINHFSSFSEALSADIIIGCIPANGISQKDIPDSMFGSDGGIIVEMSYFPLRSALMEVASTKGWQVYGGVDVLREQAYAQFEIWTGRRAPVCIIEEALAPSAGPKM